MTCSLTGLPITGGTAVRCLLLTQTPYDDREHRGSSWIVRTPPLRAKYDDYGSIHAVHPDDEPIKALWMRGMGEDLVEQGQGDNSYQDEPTSRSMSFEDLLAAIRSRRVYVTRKFDHPARTLLEGERWPGSFKVKVEAALRDQLGDRVSDRQTPGSWCVDEPVPNLVRVRYGYCESADDNLAALRRALVIVWEAGLSGDISSGSGRYGSSPDLLVFPSPSAPGGEHTFGPQWDMAPGQAADAGRPLRIGLAMIREDVWQQLIGFPHRDYLSLACRVCGQSPVYHAHGEQCPDTDAHGKPLSHPPDSHYGHGPVFPAGVEHAVEGRGDSEYVLYGLGAFRHAIYATWQRIVDRVAAREWPFWAMGDRDDEAPVQNSTPNPEHEAIIASLTQRWKAEDERVAALPREDRDRLLADKQAARERHEAELIRRRERPHFTDYPIRHDGHDPDDHISPGAWVLRDSVPDVLGIPEHLAMYLADRTVVPSIVLDGIAEFAAVRAAAAGVGATWKVGGDATWKPAVSSGPQDPDWGEQVRFSRMVLDVAQQHLAASRDCDDRPAKEEPRTLNAARALLQRPAQPTTRNPFRWLYRWLQRKWS